MNAPDHCRVCPFAINEMRKTAIMIGALESIGTPEARQALRSVAVMEDLKEQPLCAPGYAGDNNGERNGPSD